MPSSLLTLLAGIIVLGVSAQWLAWRVGLPAILKLLLFGIVPGPVTGRFNPDAIFGDLLLPIVSLSVALILYEGGLTLRLAGQNESTIPLVLIDEHRHRQSRLAGNLLAGRRPKIMTPGSDALPRSDRHRRGPSEEVKRVPTGTSKAGLQAGMWSVHLT